LTGKVLENGPQVIIDKRNGKRAQLALVMLTRFAGEFSYGKIDEDDMLVWKTSYGYEGVSLLPIRKIIIKER